MFIYIRLHYQNVSIVTALHHFGGYILGGGFTKVVNIRFKCQAHHGYHRFVMVFQFKFKHCIFNLFRTPESFIIIYFTGLGYNLGFNGKISRYEIRIHCNTMSADTTTGLKNINAGVLIGQADQFPDINTRLIANYR